MPLKVAQYWISNPFEKKIHGKEGGCLSQNRMRHKIHFRQFGKRANVLKGKNILDYAKELKISISSSCGGQGICKQCRIVIEKGCEVLNEKTELENDLNENERLACQAIIKDDSTDIYIRLSHQGSLEQIATEGGKKEVKLNPLTRKKNNRVLFDDKEIGFSLSYIILLITSFPSIIL